MKKRMLCMLLLVLTALATLSGCGAKDHTTLESPANNTSPSPTNEHLDTTYKQYSGTWAQEEIGWLNGGVILDLSVEEDTLRVGYMEITAAPISDVAEIDISISISEIQDGRMEATFENDGWGNAGTMRITFDDDQILCKISDVHYVGEDWAALWGVTETTVVLVKMNHAHSLIEYDLEDYYEIFPDENPDNWDNNDSEPTKPAPAGNTSKASGILANLGMTEDDFRVACAPLQIIWYMGSTPAYRMDSEMLNTICDYPEQYSGNYFSFPYFEVEQKGVSADGFLCYYRTLQNGPPILIFDYRDNVYSPTISEGDRISAYVIFDGIQLNGLGQDILCFRLISCDK